MGALRKWALGVLGLAPFTLLQCTGDQPVTECENVCEGLEACHLLPSALALGRGPSERRANCIERCELSQGDGQEDAAKVLDCYRKVSTKGAPKWNFCKGGSCDPLKVCLDSQFPGASATGEARVVVRAVIGASENSGAAGAAGDDVATGGGGGAEGGVCPEGGNHSSNLPAPTPAVCEETGITRVRLSSVGVTPGDVNFVQDCGATLGTGFPALTVAAGTYDSTLKVIGARVTRSPQPDGAGGQSGAGGAAGSDNAPEVVTTEPFCWRVAGPHVQLAAGVVTSVDIVIPGDIAKYTQPTANVTACEAGCLTNGDTDNDGLSGCADPACANVCALCPGLGTVAGPDCANPGCAQFSFCRSGLTSGGSAGTGGVGPASGGVSGTAGAGGTSGTAANAGSPAGGVPAGGASAQGGSGGTPSTGAGGESGVATSPEQGGAAGGSNDGGAKH